MDSTNPHAVAFPVTTRQFGDTPSATGDFVPLAEAAEPALGAISGYELVRELGRGGMGVVYQARQTGLNRLVALKMILPRPGEDPDRAAQERTRFRQEAEAVARLRHPN